MDVVVHLHRHPVCATGGK